MQVVYVMHADPTGVAQTPAPAELARASGTPLSRPVDWVLMDGLQGGSGQVFDWHNMQKPHGLGEQVGLGMPTP